MTEIRTESRPLAPALERFVLHWGEMGSQWGVNRSVAQIQALLYLSERPLTAEQIADTLVMARSNVSNSLRELLSWRLIRRVPMMGDRRDHYEAETDLWEMVTRIAQGRSEISLDLLAGSHATILSNFYERALADQPAAIRRIIEDELLTDSGFRENVAEERLKRSFASAGAVPLGNSYSSRSKRRPIAS